MTPHHIRMMRSRESGTYEHLRPQLIELLERRQMLRKDAAACIGISLGQLGMILNVLQISNGRVGKGGRGYVSMSPEMIQQMFLDQSHYERELVHAFRRTYGSDRGW